MFAVRPRNPEVIDEVRDEKSYFAANAHSQRCRRRSISWWPRSCAAAICRNPRFRSRGPSDGEYRRDARLLSRSWLASDREREYLLGLHRQPDDQLSSPGALARQDVHVARSCRKTSLRGSLLCVGRLARVAKGNVGSSRSKGRRRSGRTRGRPQDGWLQHLRARSRRQPLGIHNLSLIVS